MFVPCPFRPSRPRYSKTDTYRHDRRTQSRTIDDVELQTFTLVRRYLQKTRCPCLLKESKTRSCHSREVTVSTVSSKSRYTSHVKREWTTLLRPDTNPETRTSKSLLPVQVRTSLTEEKVSTTKETKGERLPFSGPISLEKRGGDSNITLEKFS